MAHTCPDSPPSLWLCHNSWSLPGFPGLSLTSSHRPERAKAPKTLRQRAHSQTSMGWVVESTWQIRNVSHCQSCCPSSGAARTWQVALNSHKCGMVLSPRINGIFQQEHLPGELQARALRPGLPLWPWALSSSRLGSPIPAPCQGAAGEQFPPRDLRLLNHCTLISHIKLWIIIIKNKCISRGRSCNC